MKMPKQQPVEPKAPAPMPDPWSPAILEAKRKKTEEVMNRAGRASTILTGNGGGGAGSDFSSNTLG